VAKKAAEVQAQTPGKNFLINRNIYLKRIEGLIYGEDPKGGYLENHVFYHPVIKIQFNVPQDWNYQNTPQQVIMAPKDGKAMMFLAQAQGNNLNDAVAATMQAYKLQVVASGQTTVNGLPGMVVEGQQQNEQGGVIRTLSYFIQHNGSIYHIIGAAGAADFNNYTSYFTNTMQSFRNLTDPAKINKKADRIRLKTVRSETTLEKALRSFNVADKRLSELSILNGMNLTDRVSAGMLIKVIEP
jgi:predicted Zn-dependent protease